MIERYRWSCLPTEKGNANRSIRAAVDRMEVVDRYKVQFLLEEPYVWWSALADPRACRSHARSAAALGDLKRPEPATGSGPSCWSAMRQTSGGLHPAPGNCRPGQPYVAGVDR